MLKSNKRCRISLQCIYVVALATILVAVIGPAFCAGLMDDNVSSTGWSVIAITSKVIEKNIEVQSTSGLSDGIGYWFSAYRSTFSEVRGSVCNFSPSCSRYSQEAINKYGMLKGLVMTGDRLLRCHCCINPTEYYRGTITEQGRTVYVDPVSDHASWHLSHKQ